MTIRRNAVFALEDAQDSLEAQVDALGHALFPDRLTGRVTDLQGLLRRAQAEAYELTADLERGPEPVQVEFLTCGTCSGVGEVRYLLFWWRPCPEGCCYGRVRAEVAA